MYSSFLSLYQPTRKPTPQNKGGSICTRSVDYGCYKTGRPACCNSDYTCPSFMTMCDNTGAGMGGTSICTWAPDRSCWPSTKGDPPCCSEPGGDTINCPKSSDVDKYQPCEPQPKTNPTRRVSGTTFLFSILEILYFVSNAYTFPMHCFHPYSQLASRHVSQLASRLAR